MQNSILVIARQRFGTAMPADEAALRAITDPNRLERILVRVQAAAGWDDLLATP